MTFLNKYISFITGPELIPNPNDSRLFSSYVLSKIQIHNAFSENSLSIVACIIGNIYSQFVLSFYISLIFIPSWNRRVYIMYI